jgi:hypothetical protein
VCCGRLVVSRGVDHRVLRDVGRLDQPPRLVLLRCPSVTPLSCVHNASCVSVSIEVACVVGVHVVCAWWSSELPPRSCRLLGRRVWGESVWGWATLHQGVVVGVVMEEGPSCVGEGGLWVVHLGAVCSRGVGVALRLVRV